jgi:hypothetical protein
VADGTGFPWDRNRHGHPKQKGDPAGLTSGETPAEGISYVRGFGDPEPVGGPVHQDTDDRNRDRFSYAQAASEGSRSSFRQSGLGSRVKKS